MLKKLPILARLKLRAFEHFIHRRNRRDQQSTLERGFEKFRLGSARDKFCDQPDHPLILGHWFFAAHEQSAVGNPVLVTGSRVTDSEFMEVIHEPLTEYPELTAKQETQGHIAVFCTPHQGHTKRTELHAARHMARLLGSKTVRKVISLGCDCHRLLCRYVDVLSQPRALALMMSD